MDKFLSDSQAQQLALLLAKEKAYTGKISGDRFEDLLKIVLPDCEKKVVNVRDKKWFDLSQPHRGIEVKTYQVSAKKIAPGVLVRNVLKRFGPELLPEHLTIGTGKGRQVDTSKNPADVGEAIIEYLNSSLREHAKEKGIHGDYDFAILLRNKSFTHVGYWEMPIKFDSGKNINWEWREKSLKGKRNSEEVFSWYYANQRQLFYTFIVPQNVQLLDIPDVDVELLTKEEISKLLEDTYERGYRDGVQEKI